MRLVSLVVLINFLALGAMAQAPPDQVPSDGAEDLSPSEGCLGACENNQQNARQACREERSECYSREVDRTLRIFREQGERCSAIEDRTARISCRLAAYGWARLETASAPQACLTAGQTCLNGGVQSGLPAAD